MEHYHHRATGVTAVELHFMKSLPAHEKQLMEQQEIIKIIGKVGCLVTICLVAICHQLRFLSADFHPIPT